MIAAPPSLVVPVLVASDLSADSMVVGLALVCDER
jgi:hypothetical protein